MLPCSQSAVVHALAVGSTYFILLDFPITHDALALEL